MNTIRTRLSFLLLGVIALMGATSCSEEGVAKAEIVVLEEYTAPQGQLLQTRPLEGAEVHFYVPSAPHIETIELTKSEGRVFFEYEYEALVHVDITYQNTIVDRGSITLVPGETTKKTIVVSQ